MVKPASYARVEWLFRKLLGGIYAVAFLSMAVQITGLIGSKGILPAGLYLSRIAESLGPERYWRFPSVFWAGSGDRALVAVCAAGVLFGGLAIAGILVRPALITCWVLHLSIVTVGQDFLSFQ